MYRISGWARIWGVLTLPDRVLIISLLILGVGSIGLSGALQPEGKRVVIEGVQGRVAEVPLGVVDTVEVRGPLGITRVAVGLEGARVISSPCPEQVCVRSGEIRRQGELNACVPNRVVVRITGVSGNSPDAVVR